MAFSGLYGLSRICCNSRKTEPNRIGVGLAALLDIVATVAIALLIVFGAKIGVQIPPMSQYALMFAACINMMMLLNRNIIPVVAHH